MRIFCVSVLFCMCAGISFAQGPEEEGVFDLKQNPLAPGQAPITDQRLAPAKDAGGIVLPTEIQNSADEAAAFFDSKKKNAPISKDFAAGFVTGGALIAFVAFFMLKFSKRPSP